MADVTAGVVRLGNPAKAYNSGWTYAANAWDLQRFPLTGAGQKLYIGCGNANNTGPDSNAGPVPILVYEPGVGFSTEGVSGSTINQEQVQRFRVLDLSVVGLTSGARICTPGADPRTAGDIAYYHLESGAWQEHVSGSATHNLDILTFGSALYMAVSTSGGQAVERSTNGTSWTAGSGTLGGGNHLFTFGSKLYLVTALSTSSFVHPEGIYEWQSGTSWTGVAIADAGGYAYRDMFPGRTMTPNTTPSGKIVRSAVLGSALAYIGEDVTDGEGIPFGLYSLTGISTSGVTGVTARALPNSAIPRDLLLSDDGLTLYVLGNHTSGGHAVVGVYSTTTAAPWTWTEEFTFTPNSVSGSSGEALGRSLERIGTTWYVGLGSDPGTQPVNVGDILAYDTSPSTPLTGHAVLIQGLKSARLVSQGYASRSGIRRRTGLSGGISTLSGGMAG